MKPEYSPAVAHLADAELPCQVMALDEIDGRHPGALRHPELVDQDRVADLHLNKGVTVFRWRRQLGVGGVSVGHGARWVACASAFCKVHRQTREFLEGPPRYPFVEKSTKYLSIREFHE